MSVNKIIDGEVGKLAATTNLIDMTLPFVGVQSLFFVNVYRYHGTGVDTITTEPNGEGEYFEIETDHIILHAKNYSTYAIGYKTAITEGEVTENFELVLEPVDGTNGSVYNIVLNAKDAGKVINRFTSADLTFKLTPSAPKTGNIVYSIAGNPDAYIKLNDAHSGEDRFEFYVNGKKAMKEYHDWSAESIILGTVTFGGYGTGWKFEIESAVINTTKYNDNIVITTKDSDAALTVETTKDTTTNPHTALIDPLTITPVTKNLTVNVTFPNTVADHVSDYQDMTLTVSGGDLSQDIVVKLGQTANLGGTDPTTNVTAAVAPGSYPYATTAKITSAYTAGSESTKYPYVTTVDNPLVADKYTVTLTDILTQNTLYTVTVSGAGYRTARYNVLMTGDKTLTFWNNVMDAATVVEAGKDPTLTVTYLAGDIVEDAQINIYDLSAVVSYFGDEHSVTAESPYAKYDLNRDGKIDSIDVAYVLVSWGE